MTISREISLFALVLVTFMAVTTSPPASAGPNGWNVDVQATNVTYSGTSTTTGRRVYVATVTNLGNDDAHGIRVYVYSGAQAMYNPRVLTGPAGGSCSSPTTHAGSNYRSLCTFSSALAYNGGSNNTLTIEFEVAASTTVPVAVQAWSLGPDSNSSNAPLTSNNYWGGTR